MSSVWVSVPLATRERIKRSMTHPDLKPDCVRCAALCCVALHFDRSDSFGFDKLAGEPCRNLMPGGHCRIYERRLSEGFRGCVGYDCLGAGQHVTQLLFGGRTWQKEPELLAPMMQAFATARALREHLVLVRQALRHRLPPSLAGRGEDLADALEVAVDGNAPAGRLLSDVAAFLRELRPVIREAT